MRIIVLPTPQDVAAFSAGERPKRFVDRRFSSKMELSAYEEGLEAREGHEARLIGAEINGREVLISYGGHDHDVDVEARKFVNSDVAHAFAQGVGDSTWFAGARLFVEGSPDFERLEALRDAVERVAPRSPSLSM